MKDSKKFFLGLGLLAILGLVGILVRPFSTTLEDYLVIWWKYDDFQCHAIFANPDTKWVSSEFLFENCNLEIVIIDGKKTLIGIEDSIINIYSIHGAKIDIEKTIEIPQNIRITSLPQWLTNDIIIFSGIDFTEDNAMSQKEYILKFDILNNQVNILVEGNEKGFPTNPLLSPNKKFLVYEFWQSGVSNQDQCQGECSYRFYHILDMQSLVDWNLYETIQNNIDYSHYEHDKTVQTFIDYSKYYDHCEGQWNLSEEFFAFRVGCFLQEPQFIVLANLQDFTTTLLFAPKEFKARAMGQGWADQSNFVFFTHEKDNWSYKKYDVATKIFYNLINPSQIANQVGDILGPIYIPHGNLVVGQVKEGLIFVSPQENHITNFGSDLLGQPIWSGQWIAIHNFQIDSEKNSYTNFITILNEGGGKVLITPAITTSSSDINYAWVKGQ